MSQAIHGHITPSELPVGSSLASLDVGDLEALYAAYTAAIDAMLGIMNQPRSEDIEDHISIEIDRLDVLAAGIIERVTAMTEVNSLHREKRARIMLDYAFRCGQGLEDIVVLAAEAAAIRTTKTH